MNNEIELQKIGAQTLLSAFFLTISVIGLFIQDWIAVLSGVIGAIIAFKVSSMVFN